jgi:hypothetical protein
MLAAGLMAAILATPAIGANRLKAPEILGQWCFTGEDKSERSYSAIQNLYVVPDKAELKKLVEECGDGILRFKPDRYEGWEHGCRYLSVREWDDRSKAYATKTNRGAPTAEIVAACSGEGCTWRERLVVYWSKGTLSVRSKATGERCDG